MDWSLVGATSATVGGAVCCRSQMRSAAAIMDLWCLGSRFSNTGVLNTILTYLRILVGRLPMAQVGPLRECRGPGVVLTGVSSPAPFTV
jgi:hypothetical protein